MGLLKRECGYESESFSKENMQQMQGDPPSWSYPSDL